VGALESRWLPSVSQVAFLTPPQTLKAGQASASITLQLEDSSSNSATAGSDLSFALSTTSTMGSFLDNSGNYTWGTQFATIVDGTLNGVGVEPGDIIQLWSSPTAHHTMVVARVDENGFPLEVYEQNGNYNRWLDMDDRYGTLTSYQGSITLYHPVQRNFPPTGPIAFTLVNSTFSQVTVTAKLNWS
jgi:hypothetical protein